MSGEIIAVGDAVWLALIGLCATVITLIVAPYIIWKLNKVEKSINGMKTEQIESASEKGFADGVEAQAVQQGQEPKPTQPPSQ